MTSIEAKVDLSTSVQVCSHQGSHLNFIFYAIIMNKISKCELPLTMR